MRTGVAIDGSAALAPEAAPARTSGRREILLRVLSAVILAPLGLWAVYVGGLPLMIATGLTGAVAACEWTRMAAQTETAWSKYLLYIVMAAASAAAAFVAPNGIELVALVALAACVVCAGIALAGKGSASSMAFGAIYAVLPFGCFVWIREATPNGQLFLMAILVIVWTTDIAAYFAGRGFGGPLLSPKDSPNKTWTGAIGALVCAGLAGAAVARGAGGDFVHWLIFSLALSVVGQTGDLLESRFKRLYGVKDTSGLVPGHGGVLDRLDGLIAATVGAAVALKFLPWLVPALGTAGG
ncbi:MAG: phosphatidate cytidylyltransferase [Burkholderiales bacterium]|nr:MAG: phosphatidate cytidylyltransferase [Burkholderiales bacterium]